MYVYSFTGKALTVASIVWTLHRPIASLLGARIQNIQEYRHNHNIIDWLCILYAKQKHLGCKKGEANQKQQLSSYVYNYIAIHVTKSFDIKLRPRIS